LPNESASDRVSAAFKHSIIDVVSLVKCRRAIRVQLQAGINHALAGDVVLFVTPIKDFTIPACRRLKFLPQPLRRSPVNGSLIGRDLDAVIVRIIR